MFEVNNVITIAKSKGKYLAFPDIIQNPQDPDDLHLIYREGDGGNHHPKWSKLILMRSRNGGKRWKKKDSIPLTLAKDGRVWNCPRLSYLNDELVIICDSKSSTWERTATWNIYMLRRDGYKFKRELTPMIGMVPDKIIPFHEKLLCANHKIKSSSNDLIQLVSWSDDDGETWYNTNVVAHHLQRQFCEASIVNMGDYLIAYLRDNSGHKKAMWRVCSTDGIHWSDPIMLPLYGQRVTAIKDGKNKVIGTYRDTDTLEVALFEHDLDENKVSKFAIDWEYPKNQYHFGYTGLVKTGDNSFLVAYYITQEASNPYIKLAFVDRHAAKV